MLHAVGLFRFSVFFPSLHADLSLSAPHTRQPDRGSCSSRDSVTFAFVLVITQPSGIPTAADPSSITFEPFSDEQDLFVSAEAGAVVILLPNRFSSLGIN